MLRGFGNCLNVILNDRYAGVKNPRDGLCQRRFRGILHIMPFGYFVQNDIWKYRIISTGVPTCDLGSRINLGSVVYQIGML